MSSVRIGISPCDKELVGLKPDIDSHPVVQIIQTDSGEGRLYCRSANLTGNDSFFIDRDLNQIRRRLDEFERIRRRGEVKADHITEPVGSGGNADVGER